MFLASHSWRLVWLTAIGQTVCWGTLYYGIVALAGPMEAELGWSRVQITAGVSIGLVAMGVGALPVGMLLDRFGGQFLITGGAVVGAALLALWTVVESLAAFYGLWLLMGLAMAAILYEPAFAVIQANMGERYREGITAVTLLGGLASTIFVPLTQFLVDRLGWRPALLVLAALTLVLGAGCHAISLRGTTPPRRPERNAAARPLAVALRTRAFWLLLFCWAVSAAAFSAITFHILPLLAERGASTDIAVLVVAVIGPTQVAGRLVLLAADRWLGFAAAGLVTMLLLPAGLIVLALAGTSTPLLVVGAMLYGASNGMSTIVKALAVPEIFGADGYATVTGAMSGPAALARAVAPVLVALAWTWAGGYEPVMAGLVVLCLLGAAAFAAALVVAPKRQRPEDQ